MPSYECTRHLLVLGQTHSRVAILVQGILHGSQPGIIVLIGLGREGEGVGREGKREGRGGEGEEWEWGGGG